MKGLMIVFALAAISLVVFSMFRLVGIPANTGLVGLVGFYFLVYLAVCGLFLALGAVSVR